MIVMFHFYVSSRSKVKGHLDIYLAYVPDENDSDEEDETLEETTVNNHNEEDWEIIPNNQNAQSPNNMSHPQQTFSQVCELNNVRF